MNADPGQPATDDELKAAQKLRATAFHEAGHAVMAVIVGRPVQKLTIASGSLQTGGV